jgi:hypothetical protein
MNWLIALSVTAAVSIVLSITFIVLYVIERNKAKETENGIGNTARTHQTKSIDTTTSVGNTVVDDHNHAIYPVSTHTGVTVGTPHEDTENFPTGICLGLFNETDQDTVMIRALGKGHADNPLISALSATFVRDIFSYNSSTDAYTTTSAPVPIGSQLMYTESSNIWICGNYGKMVVTSTNGNQDVIYAYEAREELSGEVTNFTIYASGFRTPMILGTLVAASYNKSQFYYINPSGYFATYNFTGLNSSWSSSSGTTLSGTPVETVDTSVIPAQTSALSYACASVSDTVDLICWTDKNKLHALFTDGVSVANNIHLINPIVDYDAEPNWKVSISRGNGHVLVLYNSTKMHIYRIQNASLPFSQWKWTLQANTSPLGAFDVALSPDGICLTYSLPDKSAAFVAALDATGGPRHTADLKIDSLSDINAKTRIELHVAPGDAANEYFVTGNIDRANDDQLGVITHVSFA